MFSKIHKSSKGQKYWPTAKRSAFMGAFAIAVVAYSAPANAHCLRHVYNYSNSTWHFEIPGQPSNNVVDRDIPSGGSTSFWIVTDGNVRDIRLTVENLFGKTVHIAQLDGSRCYIDHSTDAEDPDWDNCFTWNEPADGDVSIGRGSTRRCTNTD